MKIRHLRTVCTEVSGLTPSMIRFGGDIEEIELGDENSKLLSKGFTSPYIKNLIKDQVINRSHKFECVAKSLCNLIDDGTITPVSFSNNDAYNLLVSQFNVYQYEKRIMGFYELDKNKIYLLVDNLSIGGSGSVANTSILSLILHELMHFSFKNVKPDYMKIFNEDMLYFYKVFFEDFLVCKFSDNQIKEYLDGLYHLETTGKTEQMVDGLNVLLSYAEKNSEDVNTGYMNAKGISKLFEYLAGDVDNKTGVKIAQLSKSIFREPMIKAYNKLFAKISPELSKIYEDRKEIVEFRSVFYQEFIASSEVSAMIAGTLVKELSQQQTKLDKNNPIAKMINTIG